MNERQDPRPGPAVTYFGWVIIERLLIYGILWRPVADSTVSESYINGKWDRGAYEPHCPQSR